MRVEYRWRETAETLLIKVEGKEEEGRREAACVCRIKEMNHLLPTKAAVAAVRVGERPGTGSERQACGPPALNLHRTAATAAQALAAPVSHTAALQSQDTGNYPSKTSLMAVPLMQLIGGEPPVTGSREHLLTYFQQRVSRHRVCVRVSCSASLTVTRRRMRQNERITRGVRCDANAR